ncbi:MAG: MFS transporter [Limnochordales bacterium]|nr:hypothetical protein [Bacillota bacterium]
MRASALEGAFASASDNAGTSYVPLYGHSLGATPAQIGLLVALPNLLTNVLQVPWALLTERLGRRKQIMMLGAVGGRLLWLPLALLPWIAPSPKAAVLVLMIAVSLRAAVAGMATPAWTSLMADLVPRQVRGVYFANRNLLVNLAGFAATLLAGFLVRVGGEPGGYQLVYAFAVAAGIAAGVYMAQMPDLPWQGAPAGQGAAHPGEAREGPVPPAAATRGARARWLRLLAVFRQEPVFTRYCYTAFLWTWAVNLPAPLYAVYLVRDLGGPEAMWGLVTAANFLCTVIAQRYWGFLSQQLGEKRIMLLSGAGASILPVLWLGLPVPALAIAANGLGGFVWAGYNLASFNLLLALAPPARRTTYVAIYNSTIGLGQALGPLLGGYIADAAGIPLVFVLSTVFRAVGLWLFSRAVDTPMPAMTAADLLPLWIKWWRQQGTRAVLARLRPSLRRRPRHRGSAGRRDAGRPAGAGRPGDARAVEPAGRPGDRGRTLPGGPAG